METFCDTVSKLKQFYDSNMKKCCRRKKCSHKLKPSNSSANVDDNNNAFLSKHVEEMRKHMLGGIKNPVS